MASDSITRRFAAACGLLGQYAARTAAAPPPASVVQPGTVVQEEGNAQQLTIFYGGMVVVLDGCTPEKAAELIRLAAAAAGQGAPKPTPALVDTPIARNASLCRFLSKRKDRATAPAPAPAPVLDSEQVPLFERKNEEPAAKKGRLEVSCQEEAASWLALGSLGSMHAR